MLVKFMRLTWVYHHTDVHRLVRPRVDQVDLGTVVLLCGATQENHLPGEIVLNKSDKPADS